MAHELIKTDNYLLVVDDSEIQIDCYWHYIGENEDPVRNNLPLSWFKKLHDKPKYKRVIAHLPLNGSPILQGVDLLPPYSRHQEDGVEEAEKAFTEVLDIETKQVYDKMLLDATEHGFIIGYKKAREKYKYTEEDMRKALLIKHDGLDADYVIEVISNKYPTEFECEMKYFEVDMGLGEECIEYGQIPQKITTAQGVQWVGKYK